MSVKYFASEQQQVLNDYIVFLLKEVSTEY